MLNATFLIALLFGQANAATPPQTPAAPPPREWIVVLVSPVYLPDGSVRAETVALPTTGAGLVHVFSRRNLCAPASSGATEPTDATFGWRVASQIVTRSENDVVVSLDWRRLWDGGKKINNGPGGTVQLTMHGGDRIPLDHIPNAAPPPDCRAVGLGLEVRLARTPPAAPAPSPTSMPIGATPGGAKPVNAELWLTHTSPNDTARVFHQIVRLPEAGGRFSFTPTSVSTSRGDVNVELTGTIDRFRSPDGGEYLVLSMNRNVSGANLPPNGINGTTGATVRMPGAEEVLSFELAGAARGRGVANTVAPPGGGGVARGSGGGARGGGGGGTGGAAGVVGGRSGDATMGAAPPQQGSRGGGGGGGRGSGVSAAQLAAMLEGHQFSLRLRVTPIN